VAVLIFCLAMALLTPKLPRLKEWAYAGFVFDLTGAAISHLAVGEPVSTAIPSLVLCGVLMVSYILRPEDRRR